MSNINNPLVSVITPSWNSAKYIEKTILSVINQSYKNIEYIIIDGGSTDGTLEIINAYKPWISKLISEPDKGMYEAINKGLRQANGEIVAYLNSDDQYCQNAIESIVSIFKEKKEFELIYGDLTFVDKNGDYLFKQKYPDFNLDRLIRSNFCMIGQPAAFWRNNLHGKIGYFDESYKLVADYDFFIRAALCVKIMHTSQALAIFRLHSGSLTLTNKEIGRREVMNVQNKYLANARGAYSKILKAVYSLQFKILNISTILKKIGLRGSAL